jgi:hypothetical protein
MAAVYQTKANWLLRHAMLNFTGENGLSKREGIERRPKAKENHAGMAEDTG